MTKQQNITLGSLFDGIGGFPYAGSFFGIESLWASEILPGAISVTRRHLPHMEHVGDITQLRGDRLPPVDIITFGSPCQDLSVAGKRQGLSGERSGLFQDAIRIINEMREATNGKYPTWAVWENVPGALSSNRGLDFRAVLEAFTEAEIPIPRSGRWTKAGMVRGGRADLAWCVYNAQHFGTAQRRRRIFLIADFGGERAGEILFVPKSLQGYFAAGGTPRQGPAAYASRGADSPVEILNDQGGNNITAEKDGHSPTLRCETHGHLPVVAREAYPINTQIATRHKSLGKNTGFGVGDAGDPAYTLQEARGHAVAVCDTCFGPNCLTPWDTQQSRIFTDDGASPTLAGADGGGGRNPGGLVYTAGFCAGAGAKANGIGYEDECAPTLKGGACGFQMPTVVCAAFMGDSSPSSYGIEYSEETSPTLKPRLSGTPCLCEPKHTQNNSGPCADNTMAAPSPDILCAATGQTGAEVLENQSPTLTCHHEQPILYKTVGVYQNQSGYVNTSDTAYSLTTNGNATGRNAPLVAHPVMCAATTQANAEICEELCPTITEAAGKGGNNKPYIVHPDVSGTLCASGAGLSRTAGMASETDLCVVQPIPINDKATRCSGGGPTRKDDGAGNGLGVGQPGDPAPTITAGDRHAVAAVDCRNLRETEELSGTLQAKENGSYSLNYQNPVRMGYIVRRLTPTECERLQGYPDGWTAYGYDGKTVSDTARYMMLGNSIAVPCVAYIMLGIAEAHRKDTK